MPPVVAIEGLATEGLRIDRFAVHPGEAWCVVGGIGSGIEPLVDLLSGERNGVRAGRLHLPSDLGLLSFKRQQSLYEEELRKDETDFLDRLDPGTPARAFLTAMDRYRDLIELFGLAGILDRGYRQLSSGQARKLLLLQQLTRGAAFLVLEGPYEGLDQAGRQELDRVLAGLRDQGVGLLLLVNNQEDIPLWCTHLAALQDGLLACQGERDRVLPQVLDLLARQEPLFRVSVEELRREQQPGGPGGTGTTLVTLRNGFARYGEVEVFAGLDLTVNRGDHTLITGPNGCGKSTLLQLITGDHPLGYVNDLTLFGRRRGSGESIWELKSQMGILSPDLHRNHRVAGSALAIVLSGLFDSIGLYTHPTSAQEALGRRWLRRLGLAHRAQQPFRRLSHGEQRLLLLARALIKAPPLLVLDEPTQGLDQRNRTALLDFLGEIAGERLATIVYVSHRPD